MADLDVAIIGAGAAGLGAAKRARELGLTFVVVEAGHRIGGRAYTEEIAPGVPFDLGCHWLHSASINPFTRVADEHGFAYARDFAWERKLHIDGHWANADEAAERERFFAAAFDALAKAGDAGRDVSFAEVTERESRVTPFFDYVASLMASVDPDEISVQDFVRYRDTDENWPVKDGYGALVAKWAAEVPVTLNAPVARVAWGGRAVELVTPKGTIRARAAIVTVSTGVLANGTIEFDPPLPDWKRAAYEALPLGVHNRIGIALDRDPFGSEVARGLIHADGRHEPMHLQIRPFGHPMVVGVTGGRFGAWLERAGAGAAVDHLAGRLKAVFGNDVAKGFGRAIVTAWGGDPLTFGSYSAARPGTGWRRPDMARPIDGRLYFAGEAASLDSFSTCHGAMLSGIRAADDVAATSGIDRRAVAT